MKLVVPHTGELHSADARLIRLAEFLGIRCKLLRLDKQVQARAEYFEKAVPDQAACLVINPQVLREWVGGDVLPPDLAPSLVSRFPHLLVHGLTPGPFVDRMISALSNGSLQSVQPIVDGGQLYEINANANDICFGPFAGLSFGPIDLANDHVLAADVDNPNLRKLISIGGSPLMAALQRDKTEILFLASEDAVDINAEVGSAPLSDYFSRLIPHAMALRHIFGKACWLPGIAHASIIIDDPLLRRDYGYVNFQTLLQMTEEYNFHTSIAFIPHNYRRNSAKIIRVFRENPRRLSICYHGNDHTQAEFASTDTTRLNTMLGIARERMRAHEESTGLPCDDVMVFPQGDFSAEAMAVLKSRNFHAAVNSVPYPAGQPVSLTIAEIAQPAVLRFGGFPLFIRTYITGTQSQDIAFNLFFGRPALFVEHHEIFKHPAPLLEAVRKVNMVAPGITWSNLESAVGNSFLQRRMPDGTVQVRAYSSSVRIANDSSSVERLSIEWGPPGECSPVDHVLRDGTALPGVEADDVGTRVSVELAPGTSQEFSVVHGNRFATLGKLGFRWNAKAIIRRRLSEFRDNYLSKNQHVLTAAKSLRRRFLS